MFERSCSKTENVENILLLNIYAASAKGVSVKSFFNSVGPSEAAKPAQITKEDGDEIKGQQN